MIIRLKHIQNPQWWHYDLWSFDREVIRIRFIQDDPTEYPIRRGPDNSHTWWSGFRNLHKEEGPSSGSTLYPTHHWLRDASGTSSRTGP
jgi:hypothetical protein